MRLFTNQRLVEYHAVESDPPRQCWTGTLSRSIIQDMWFVFIFISRTSARHFSRPCTPVMSLYTNDTHYTHLHPEPPLDTEHRIHTPDTSHHGSVCVLLPSFTPSILPSPIPSSLHLFHPFFTPSILPSPLPSIFNPFHPSFTPYIIPSPLPSFLNPFHPSLHTAHPSPHIALGDRAPQTHSAHIASWPSFRSRIAHTFVPHRT